MIRVVLALSVALGAAASCADAFGQMHASDPRPEPELVAQQFPELAEEFETPGFRDGRSDFTSHAELQGFLAMLAAQSDSIRLESLGTSVQGRAITLARLTGSKGIDPALPTVLVVGEQHGNEPAGGEAALVLIQRLATARRDLLERVNLLVVPRANPDGADAQRRNNLAGRDVNRDHLLLRSREAQAIAVALNRYRPQVVLDLHEFTVGGRWVAAFGGYMRYDALLQGAGTANLSPVLEATQRGYLAAARIALESRGLLVNDYFTKGPNSDDLVIRMGGVNVDTLRNTAGLRQAVSLVVETRGVGLGRAHFRRRVAAQVTSAMAVIERAAREPAELMTAARRAADERVAQACRGDLEVVVDQIPERRTISLLDAATGEPRDHEVDWRSSWRRSVQRARARPCGYLISAAQADAVARMRTLGIEVQVVVAPARSGGPAEPGGAAWKLERYSIHSIDEGRRRDGRGVIDDEQPLRALRVGVVPSTSRPEPGDFYVPMDQPLAGLVSAIIEPDSQDSYAAHRMLEVSDGQVLRVRSPPPAAELAPLRQAADPDPVR